jgi:HD-GYP domain-containing protein (c-di-GMP phosphodiesterase class II)
MAINYKKELEAAAKSMILVHEPDTLIRMIVRTIVNKVKVSHAGILLYDKEKDAYVLSVSRGPTGQKIPAGFARMDMDNPLIRFFKERWDKKLLRDGSLVYCEAKGFLKKRMAPESKELLKKTLYQMEIFDVEVCLPTYFEKELLGILLLGRKKKNICFRRDELDFFTALASDVVMAIRNAKLFKDLQTELEKERNLFIHTTVALATAIDAKDHYTHGHTSRVTKLTMEIAKKISQKYQEYKKKIDEKFMESLHIASLLHDIGKIGISDNILNKSGPLDEKEKQKMHEHPSVGASIMQPIKELSESLLGVKYHHERYDGSGYPEGLKGDRIPLIALIISVADAFDAMTTDRPYRRALSKEEAVLEITRASGKQFDPVFASALTELYQEGRI